jgi:hypothetical protein
MKHVADYIESGKPIVGIRTATHAFSLTSSPTFAKYNWNNPDGGFGRLVLGETWINHHGQHGKQSSLGIINPTEAAHPILTGIHPGEVWSKTDVYEAHLPLPGDSTTLLFGQVLTGMNASDPPVAGKVNDPMMPIAWVKTYTGTKGKTARIFTTTMGASEDLSTEANRRMLVNACYWALGLERQIDARYSVGLVGEYRPHPFGFGGYIKGVKPEDFVSSVRRRVLCAVDDDDLDRSFRVLQFQTELFLKNSEEGGIGVRISRPFQAEVVRAGKACIVDDRAS